MPPPYATATMCWFAAAPAVSALIESGGEQSRQELCAAWAERPSVGDVLWPDRDRISNQELRRALRQREEEQVAQDAARIERKTSTAERAAQMLRDTSSSSAVRF